MGKLHGIQELCAIQLGRAFHHRPGPIQRFIGNFGTTLIGQEQLQHGAPVGRPVKTPDNDGRVDD